MLTIDFSKVDETFVTEFINEWHRQEHAAFRWRLRQSGLIAQWSEAQAK